MLQIGGLIINFFNLRYFLEIAKTLNFTNAAKNLNISQPGLSQHINNLEHQLGFKLFYRTTKIVSLTAEGKFLHSKLAGSYQKIESTFDDIQKNIMLPISNLKMAMVPSAAITILPKILETAQRRFPNLNLLLEETDSVNAINLMLEKKCQIALIRTPQDTSFLADSGLNYRELQRHPVKLIVSSDHELAKHSEVLLSDLKNERFISHHKVHSASLHFLFEKACFYEGFSPQTICEGSELHTVLTLVSHNIGIGIMPMDILEVSNILNVKAIDIKNQKLESSITIVWRDSFYLESLIEEVIQMIHPNINELSLY
ncbi:LysR family transcriptional regulator [Sporosarcina sp. FA9]|uniref:LysR family transcriptional regulator n=1 Tax=Sporosarcina sp. FA9 TaxID=3413030 RepID=UPI003F65DA4D